MLVMVVFFIAFRWIHLSTPLIRLFLLVLILLLMPTLNFLPVWFALSLLRFRLPSRLPMMFILRSEERFSRNAETDLVCRLLLEKKNREVSLQRYELFWTRTLVLPLCESLYIVVQPTVFKEVPL